MNRDADNLKVVKILDAVYCVRCDFAYVADVLMDDGKQKKMFYCARRDCDNWQLESAPSADDKPGESICAADGFPMDYTEPDY